MKKTYGQVLFMFPTHVRLMKANEIELEDLFNPTKYGEILNKVSKVDLAHICYVNNYLSKKLYIPQAKFTSYAVDDERVKQLALVLIKRNKNNKLSAEPRVSPEETDRFSMTPRKDDNGEDLPITTVDLFEVLEKHFESNFEINLIENNIVIVVKNNSYNETVYPIRWWKNLRLYLIAMIVDAIYSIYGESTVRASQYLRQL